MNTNFPRPSAKIYQFPIQGRETLDRRKPVQKATVAHYMSRPAEVMVSGAWYHDAAIKDDDHGRKG